jgi:aspartyl-tRNA synthetase
MTYEHAMKTGNDKPDIRFGMEFGELNEFAQHKEFPVFNAASSRNCCAQCWNALVKK